MKFLRTALIVICITSCTNSHFLHASHFLILLGTILGALGLYGKYYFSEKSDNEAFDKNSEKVITSSTPIDINIEKVKEWSLDKDAPIILETIDIHINLSIDIYLNKGEQIQTEITKWKVGGRFPILDFIKDWESGIIPLDQVEGKLSLENHRLEIKNPKGEIIEREFKLRVANYKLSKKYFLTNTAALPNSSEISDFDSKKVKRIFTEDDLVKFDIENAKAYERLDDIPAQTDNVIHFRRKPKFIINN